VIVANWIFPQHIKFILQFAYYKQGYYVLKQMGLGRYGTGTGTGSTVHTIAFAFLEIYGATLSLMCTVLVFLSFSCYGSSSISTTDPDPEGPNQCGSTWIWIRNHSFVSSADNWANHALAHNFEETGRALQVLQIIFFLNYVGYRTVPKHFLN
jgi:hypothetical protein